MSDNAELDYNLEHDLWQEDWADQFRGNYETFINPLAIKAMQAELTRLREENRELASMLKWALSYYRLPQSYFKGHPEHVGYDKAIELIKGNYGPTSSHLIEILLWLKEQMHTEQKAGVSGFEDWIKPIDAALAKHNKGSE